MQRIHKLVLLAFTCLLTACGGGGGSSTPAAPLPPPPANVLLVMADSTDANRNDIVGKLNGFGVFGGVGAFAAHTGTPTLAELQAFDVVLLVSNSNFSDSTALGNVMADYVDAGGALVLGMFSMSNPGSDTPEGRFVTDNYYAIERSVSNGSLSDAGLSAVDSTHPILQGVTTFDGGGVSFSPEGSVLGPGATMIATWDDGASTPMVAVREIGSARRVDLGFFPVTTDSGSASFLDPTTDAMLLVANALRWASRRL